MPAKSKSQQRLFGMAYAAKKDKTLRDKLPENIKKLSDSMSKKTLKEFAATKHDDIKKSKQNKEKQKQNAYKPKEEKIEVSSKIKSSKTNALNLKQYKTASVIERFIQAL